MKGLSRKINKVFKEARVVTSFLNENHYEFILLEQKNEFNLIWLPTSMGMCVLFPLSMNKEKFIDEFSSLPIQNRLTYVIQNFIESNFKDLSGEISLKLQLTLNSKRNGLH